VITVGEHIRTADHGIVHADGRATNLVDQKSFYMGFPFFQITWSLFTVDPVYGFRLGRDRSDWLRREALRQR